MKSFLLLVASFVVFLGTYNIVYVIFSFLFPGKEVFILSALVYVLLIAIYIFVTIMKQKLYEYDSRIAKKPFVTIALAIFAPGIMIPLFFWLQFRIKYNLVKIHVSKLEK